MKIAVFTSNQPRHISLIERLAEISDEVFAVQECTTLFPGMIADEVSASSVMEDYMGRVRAAETKLFGTPRFLPASVRSIQLRIGDISRLDVSALAPAIAADVHVVFGSSWIRGPLAHELIKRNALNIHMGVSPYYRGSSCNFWAIHDERPNLVGATIHRLSAGLDNGPILFHALPPQKSTPPFDLGMKAVMAAQVGLTTKIKSGEIFDMPLVPQDRSMEIRYTRSADFTEVVAEKYLNLNLDAASIGAMMRQSPSRLLVNPFIL